MQWLTEATAFDILILIIFLAFLIRGIWIGFIRQISSLLAIIGGFLLAGYFDNDFYRFVLPYFNNPQAAFLITYIVLVVAFFFLIKLLGLGLSKVMDITLANWFDRSIGGLFGIIKGLFVSSLILVFITSYLSGSNKYLKESITYPLLSQSAAVILSTIRDYDLRSYFIPREPAIQLPSFDDLSDDQKFDNTRTRQEEDKSGESGRGSGEQRILL